MPTPLEICISDYIKYEGSTAVLAALARLVEDHSEIGKVHGVTRDIHSTTGSITPDVSVKSSNGKAAIFFELKWTLTNSTAADEILKLKKYLEADFRWDGSRVDPIDVVFVINEEDATVVVSAADSLVASEVGFPSKGLAIWKWHYSSGRSTHGEPSIWFEKIWGSSINRELETLVSSASGYQTPPEVLRYLRWTYRFTKDKPPVQYTIGALLIHVFSSFRTRTDVKETLRISSGMTDAVYDRAKVFFPNRDPSNETVQVRKEWIREALRMMINISLGELRVPPSTGGNVQEYLCRKIRDYLGRRPRGSGLRRTRKAKPSPLDSRLM